MKFYDQSGQEVFFNCETCSGELTYIRRTGDQIFLRCADCDQTFSELEEEKYEIEDELSEAEEILQDIKEIILRDDFLLISTEKDKLEKILSILP